MRRLSLILLSVLCCSVCSYAQDLTGRIYFGEDILNQGTEKSNVEASIKLEFVSQTEVKQTPTIKAKPGANFMMKFGLNIAQKKMAKAVAKKPLLKYTIKDGVITVIGGGKKGKGDSTYILQNDGTSLQCNDGKKTYTLKRIK